MAKEASGSLRVTEVFYSLQGEANTVGWPTVFIRLTGCPLRCHYCDTPYAFAGGEKRAIEDLLAETLAYGCRYVTVTGGEPLAQPECLILLKALAEQNLDVSLETSGAFDIRAVDPRVAIVMDLKTPGSGEMARNCYDNIAHLKPIDQVKMVLSDAEDYHWAKQILAKYDLAARCTVLFSPVFEKMSPTQLAEWILADRLPVRMQIQLHKLLWGETPGR